MLTENQKRLVEENINLPKQICYKLLKESKIRHNTDLYEDCVATANVSLCQAAMTYDEKKGKFHVFATIKIRWDIWNYLRTEYSKGMISSHTHNTKIENIPTQFLDVETLGDAFNNKNPQTIADSIKISKDDTPIVDSMLDLMKITTAAEQTILSLILDGYNDEEIADILDVDRKYISKLKSNLKIKMLKTFKHCA